MVGLRCLSPDRYLILTASKDQRNNTVSFKSASLDQIWSCLQRCLFFEEPSERWNKLIAQVSRHVNGKARDLNKTSLAEQQKSFLSVFGTPLDLIDPTARMFNLVLAMQDLLKFESADFDLWYFSSGNDENASGVTEIPEIFKTIAGDLLAATPSFSQTASLLHAWNVVPYWRVLDSFGPWANEPLAEFVSSILRKFDKMDMELNLDSVFGAHEEFVQRLSESRTSLPSNFQPALIVLVEGNTESILLSKFLTLSKNKTSDQAVMFNACGGANQLLRKYLQLRDVCSLPIVCVMDHDAVEQTSTIEDVLREGDYLHTWSAGEIEDTFSVESLYDSLNAYLHSLGVAEPLKDEDLYSDLRRTELLDKLWRNRGLGDFDKVGFAEFQATRLKNVQDIPAEGQQLMRSIMLLSAPSKSDQETNKLS